MLGDAKWLSSFLPFLFATHLFVDLSLLLRQQRSVDVAASLEPTVAASAELTFANFEVGHGLQGLGSVHQEPRVGGTLGGAFRDRADGWRSPVPRSDITGEFFYFSRQPSRVGPADRLRTS